MMPIINSLIKLRDNLKLECDNLENTIESGVEDWTYDPLHDHVRNLRLEIKFLDQTLGRALSFNDDLCLIELPRWLQTAIMYEESKVYNLLMEREICIDQQSETKTNPVL